MDLLRGRAPPRGIEAANGAGLRAAKPNPKARFPNRSFGGSNGPLRAGKGQTFEGGIRVPCIAWWPGKIAAGRTERTPASAMDIFPTLARLAGTTPPAEEVLDGIDLGPVLRGNQPPAEPRMLFHYFGVQLQAVREGPWKLILPTAQYPSRRTPSLWYEHQPGLFERQHRMVPRPSLFNLNEDLAEPVDVANRQPEVTTRLLAKARDFGQEFQAQIPPVEHLAGPRPPAPGQIRRPDDDVSAWRELSR